jgi:SNF2 family DNA or RNA helicase
MAWAAIDPDGKLAIGCAQSENHLAQQIPGCNLSKTDGLWRVPLSWPAYVAMRTVWGSQPLTVFPALQAWASNAWSDVQIAYGLRSQIDAPPQTRADLVVIEASLADTAPHLFTHQRGAVAWLATMKRAMLEDPLGNGKTPSVIRALQLMEFREKGSALPALVVCTGAALYGWLDEFAAWAPEIKVQIVTGTALKRRRALEEPADVYLLAWPNVRLHTRLANYPGQRYVRCTECGGIDPKVKAGRCEVHLKELNTKTLKTIVADEAHRMQDAKSKQTRAVWHLAFSAPNFWPVTGTPVTDAIDTLWPILHGIDPEGFPSKSRYLDLFAIKDYSWHGGFEVLDIRPDTAAAFHAIVQPLMRRIPKEMARPDARRLPDIFRYPEMEPSQAAAYAQLKKDLLADLGGYTMVPDNAVVKFGRLCQLAATSIEIRDGEDQRGFTTQVVELVPPSSKVSDLMEYLSDHPGQLVVAANSPRLITLAGQKLADAKITHCKIVGGMSAQDKHQAIQWFQNGECRVIFLTQAGGESITLTAANTIFFMQPDPSLISREQKIGRVDRIGQPDPVQVVYSISRGTVEERLYKLGCEKEERAASVTRDADLLRWIIQGDDNDVTKAQRAAQQGPQQLPFPAQG